MVALFVVLVALTALAIVGVIYVVIHDHLRRTPAADGADGLQLAGGVMALLFPLGGFIAGAVLLSRRPLQGSLIMMVSVAMGIFYVGLAL